MKGISTFSDGWISKLKEKLGINGVISNNVLGIYASTDWQTMNTNVGTFLKSTGSLPSYGTVVNNTARYRRDGSDLLLEWDFTQGAGGTIGSGSYLIDISQLGLQIDTSQKPINTETSSTSASTLVNSSVGTAGFTYQTGASDSSLAEGVAVPYSSTQVKIVSSFTTVGGAVSYGMWGVFYPMSFHDIAVTVRLRIPILGWSDKENNVVVSGTKTTYAYVEAAGNAGQSITANVTDIPFNTVSDTKGLWNGSHFTADRDMTVSVSGAVYMTTVGTRAFGAYVNGVILYRLSQAVSDDTYRFNGTIKLKAGDVFSIRGTAGTLNNVGIYHNIVIKELPNYEDLILAYLDDSKVSGTYVMQAANAFNVANGVETNISGLTKINNNGNGLSYNSTTGTWTVIKTGRYAFNISVYFVGTNSLPVGGAFVGILKGGNYFETSLSTLFSGSEMWASGYIELDLNSGETFSPFVWQNSGGAKTISVLRDRTRLTFHRIR